MVTGKGQGVMEDEIGPVGRSGRTDGEVASAPLLISDADPSTVLCTQPAGR